MSEYQYVGFRAIDAPVSEKDLEFMRRQSSRAMITPWSFDNEYHFGDFHGNTVEMLRRGYDLHLHYANFGIRELLIRLPRGLPDAEAANPYLEGRALEIVKDKQGPGATLHLSPFHEPGDLPELWEIGELLDQLVPLRAEILSGDLRPLYLARLAIACDGYHDPNATKEGPVPAGLGDLSDAQHALAQLYALDEHLIAAAAQGGPSSKAPSDAGNTHAEWLQRQSKTSLVAWLTQLLSDQHSTVRREILAEFQKDHCHPSWPTFRGDRTIAQLRWLAEAIESKANRKAAESAARRRAKRLANMAADPMRIIRQTEQLAARRSTESYHQVAVLLADLREALAGSGQSSVAERQARKLRKEHPTLHRLTAELRRQGFLEK